MQGLQLMCFAHLLGSCLCSGKCVGVRDGAVVVCTICSCVLCVSIRAPSAARHVQSGMLGIPNSNAFSWEGEGRWITAA